MSDGAPSVPGFRSLTQAGIQLKDGLERAHVSEVTANQVKAAAEDPNWPPMPTMGQDEAANAEKTRSAATVAVQPREPGTKRPLPRDVAIQGQGAAVGQGLVPQPVAAPQGHYVGRLPTVKFTCPRCTVLLTIPNPEAYNGEPGPCPRCASLIIPPRAVSPFSIVTHEVALPAEAPVPAPTRHFSGHQL